MAQLLVRSVVIVAIVSLILLLSIDKPWGVGAKPPATLTDLHDVKALRLLFNQDVGRPRLILLLSPTCAMCRADASWVQEEILAKHPSPILRVYAVWLLMVWSDTRRAWESSVLVDPRVIHLWDEKRTTGPWFAKHIEGYRGISWDAYYVYGPEARWDLAPSPLIRKGRTIYHQRWALQTSLLPLLED